MFAWGFREKALHRVHHQTPGRPVASDARIDDCAPLQDDSAMLDSLLDFVSSSLFIGAIAQGLCYAAVGCGVYMTFRTLAFPDLTIDGSLPLGAGISAVLILQAQWSP